MHLSTHPPYDFESQRMRVCVLKRVTCPMQFAKLPNIIARQLRFTVVGSPLYKSLENY